MNFAVIFVRQRIFRYLCIAAVIFFIFVYRCIFWILNFTVIRFPLVNNYFMSYNLRFSNQNLNSKSIISIIFLDIINELTWLSNVVLTNNSKYLFMNNCT